MSSLVVDSSVTKETNPTDQPEKYIDFTEPLEGNDEEKEEVLEWVPIRKRKNIIDENRLRRVRQRFDRLNGEENTDEDQKKDEGIKQPTKSLFEERAEMLKNPDSKDFLNPMESIEKIETSMLQELSQFNKALLSVKEIATSVTYQDPLYCNWKPPRYLQKLPKEDIALILEDIGVYRVDGENPPPPCFRFKDMKMPRAIINTLKKKGIKNPTPIQAQGIPVALCGRDMIGIASTGTGKTLAFVLPMIFIALQQEMKMSIASGEGPFGMVICPSRELANQTYEVCLELTEALYQSNFPKLNTLLCIGGQPMHEQTDRIKRGIHMIIATPGRVIHLLSKKMINLVNCRYFCMDEADRLIDSGFEEDMRSILDYFSHQRQTLLFSATMPEKIQNFAETALNNPIKINISGRAGAANMDIIQEVELVNEEEKILHLLETLQKTPPPVLIFTEKKKDVDDIHEYLLLKGVEVCSIHGGKDQREREEAIQQYKAGKKDVLVASDIVSKGIDFHQVQHIINYDMPKEIENYVHRIGRTGRNGKTGVATTYVNPTCSLIVLLDLKYLLMEAKQKIPDFLARIEGGSEAQIPVNEVKGCVFCGGLGHRVADCEKFKKEQTVRSNTGRSSDFQHLGSMRD